MRESSIIVTKPGLSRMCVLIVGSCHSYSLPVIPINRISLAYQLFAVYKRYYPRHSLSVVLGRPILSHVSGMPSLPDSVDGGAYLDWGVWTVSLRICH